MRNFLNEKIDLCIFALINSYFENNKSYLDAFAPFVLKVFKKDETLKETEIINRIKERFNLTIPLNIFRMITNNLCNEYEYLQKICKKGANSYKLTSVGLDYLNSLPSEESVREEIEGLLIKIKKTKQKNGQNITLEKMEESLLNLLYKNLEIFFLALHQETRENVYKLKEKFRAETEEENLILEYFLETSADRGSELKKIEDIIFASLLYFAINSGALNIIEDDFEELTVFLDSNLLIELLGYDYSDIKIKYAEDVLNVLKSNPNIHIKYFDITEDEIVSLFKGYLIYHKYTYYPEHDVYIYFEKEGFDQKKINNIIKNLGRNLSSLGIKKFNIKNNLLKDITISSDKIESYKKFISGKTGTKSYKHDLLAIEAVRKLREKNNINTELVLNSKYIFLTSSLNLYLYNYIECGNNLPEVLFDRVLCGLLWLRKPEISKKVSFNTILAIEVKGNKFLDSEMKYNVIRKIKETKNSGKKIGGEEIEKSLEEHLKNKASSDSKETKEDAKYGDKEMRDLRKRVEKNEKKIEKIDRRLQNKTLSELWSKSAILPTIFWFVIFAILFLVINLPFMLKLINKISRQIFSFLSFTVPILLYFLGVPFKISSFRYWREKIFNRLVQQQDLEEKYIKEFKNKLKIKN